VGFTCANREKGEHKGITYLPHTKRNEWRGLCQECLGEFVDPKKNIEDKTIDGAQLLFSQEDEQGRVPILYDVCKHVRLAPRQTSLGYLWAGRLTGVCQKCRNNPSSLAERLSELARAASGNGQQDDIRLPKLLTIGNAVIAVWGLERSPNLPLHGQLNRVTEQKVSVQLGGHTASAGLARARLRRLHVNDIFPEASSWWDAFVNSVITDFEKKATPEAIVFGLIRQLDRSRLAA
jgi:hypothetical protein